MGIEIRVVSASAGRSTRELSRMAVVLGMVGSSLKISLFYLYYFYLLFILTC